MSQTPCWELPHRWRQVAELVTARGGFTDDVVRLLEERDRALEEKLCSCCGGGVAAPGSVLPQWVVGQAMLGPGWDPTTIAGWGALDGSEIIVVYASKNSGGSVGAWTGVGFHELQNINNFKSSAITAARVSDVVGASYGYASAEDHFIGIVRGVDPALLSSSFSSSLEFYYAASPVDHGNVTTPAKDNCAVMIVREGYNTNGTQTIVSSSIDGIVMAGTPEIFVDSGTNTGGKTCRFGLLNAGLSSPGLHDITTLPGGAGGGAADSFAGAVILPPA